MHAERLLWMEYLHLDWEDRMEFRLHSDTFDWHWRKAYTHTDLSMRAHRLPPFHDICRMGEGMLLPMARAFNDAPFSKGFMKPLFAETIGRMANEFFRLLDRLADRPTATEIRERARSRLVVDPARVNVGDLLFAEPGGLVRVTAHGREPAPFLNAATRGRDILHGWIEDELVPAGRLENFAQIYQTTFTVTEDAAVKRSREMLIKCLGEDQRKQFLKTNEFFVIGSDQRKYLVMPRQSYNAKDTSSGVEYCAVPSQPVPIFDKMMATKLWLETNAEEFKRVANKTSPTRRQSIFYDLEARILNPRNIAALTI